MRTALCSELGIKDDVMPFAGELIRVREDVTEWEGAIERVLHNFGLSLLVPDQHYERVASWVDSTHLGGRLVYFRVRANSQRPADPGDPRRDSLIRKLDIRQGSAFFSWIEREIGTRFDYVCCDTQEQFRRETFALTRAGQIKAQGVRHEKDDRHRLDDRSRFVLGWSNLAKIDTLENQKKKLEAHLADVGGQIAQAQKEQTKLREQLESLAALKEFSDFREMDWQACSDTIASLREEKAKLEAASDTLRELTARLQVVQAAQKESERALSDLDRELGSVEAKRGAAEELRQQVLALLAELSEDVRSRLVALRAEILGEHQLSIESCDNREREMRDALQGRMDAEGKRLERLTEKIIKAMSAFKEAYKLETADFDASIEAAFEYQNLLDQLVKNDLPRFELRFKELLNVNTIREIANFNAQLSRERENIRERIASINGSLTQIDYNSGRYIKLESQPTPDPDIRDFLADLRACTESALTGSEDAQYSETKFLRVKVIIDRFRGREGLSEQDRRWTVKVTDVRNWFLFAASERWREDDHEHEHYSDSGGKSGGQKEKLAYTILAASLAYQFKLEWGAKRSRSFHFVVIDEAFGRGSDESAQYGLKLFKQLNLQLLIVTPMQKIHVIEPFVASVAFVQNEDGNESKLLNLSIEEYRERKAEFSV